jgi:hypothetical protein
MGLGEILGLVTTVATTLLGAVYPGRATEAPSSLIPYPRLG